MQPHSYKHSSDIEKAVISLGKPSLEWTTIYKDNVSIRTFTSNSSTTAGLRTSGEEDVFVSTGPRRHVRVIRLHRYGVFTVYHRLFTLVFILNVVAAGILFQHQQHQQQSSSEDVDKSIISDIDLNSLSTLASANFLAAILIRQDWFVNILFRSAWLVPWNVPLRVRKMAARVYCYG